MNGDFSSLSPFVIYLHLASCRVFFISTLNSDFSFDFTLAPNGDLKTYLNVFKVKNKLIIMGGVDVPFQWEKTYSFLTINGLTAVKSECGMLAPVQASGQEITLLNVPQGGNAITINAAMPQGFYYMVMAIEI